MIRMVASGKRGSGRYRIRSERIREWGYKSLVNRYHRFIRRASGSQQEELQRGEKQRKANAMLLSKET